MDRQITWIWKIALAHCAHAWMIEVFNTWRLEMSDLNGRMRNHWTQVEKLSLIALLTRFEKVLRQLLQPPLEASVYAPAARQAADPTRVIELFVSGAHFFASGSFVGGAHSQQLRQLVQHKWNARFIMFRVVSRGKIGPFKAK